MLNIRKKKPEARLERWSVVNGKLYGEVYGHHDKSIGEGDFVRTSAVVQGDIAAGATVETRNTAYTLGEPYVA